MGMIDNNKGIDPDYLTPEMHHLWLHYRAVQFATPLLVNHRHLPNDLTDQEVEQGYATRVNPMEVHRENRYKLYNDYPRVGTAKEATKKLPAARDMSVAALMRHIEHDHMFPSPGRLKADGVYSIWRENMLAEHPGLSDVKLLPDDWHAWFHSEWDPLRPHEHVKGDSVPLTGDTIQQWRDSRESQLRDE